MILKSDHTSGEMCLKLPIKYWADTNIFRTLWMNLKVCYQYFLQLSLYVKQQQKTQNIRHGAFN